MCASVERLILAGLDRVDVVTNNWIGKGASAQAMTPYFLSPVTKGRSYSTQTELNRVTCNSKEEIQIDVQRNCKKKSEPQAAISVPAGCQDRHLHAVPSASLATAQGSIPAACQRNI